MNTLKDIIKQFPHLIPEPFSGFSRRGEAKLFTNDPISQARLIRPRLLLHPLDFRDFLFEVDPKFSKVQFHIENIKRAGESLEATTRDLKSFIDYLVEARISAFKLKTSFEGVEEMSGRNVGNYSRYFGTVNSEELQRVSINPLLPGVLSPRRF